MICVVFTIQYIESGFKIARIYIPCPSIIPSQIPLLVAFDIHINNRIPTDVNIVTG